MVNYAASKWSDNLTVTKGHKRLSKRLEQHRKTRALQMRVRQKNSENSADRTLINSAKPICRITCGIRPSNLTAIPYSSPSGGIV